MRHGKKINHLSRTSAQRKALMAGLATNLISNKRISTTVAKAKALRKYVEPLITKAKDDTTHSRRTVFSYLQDKDAVTVLFGEVAQKIGERPGGYTRIIKTGARLGDAAETCIIELVDFNEFLLKDAKSAEAKKTTRRSRRGKSSSDKPAAEAKEVKAETKAPEAKAEEVKEVAAETQEIEGEAKKETPKPEVKAKEEEAPKKEDSESKE